MLNDKHWLRSAFVFCLGAVLFGLSAVRAQTSAMAVRIHEAGSAVALPCRAWIVAGGQRFFNPAGESCTAYARDRSFSCDGRFVIDVPWGKAVIHVERGGEYRPVDKEIVVEEGRTGRIDITLNRWVNMSRDGWYSADIHCHFGLDNMRVLRQLALADDVNFEPILSLWNHQTPAPPGGVWPEWPGGSSIYADDTHLVTLRNQEIERIGGEAFESVGALLMFGLEKPVEMPPAGSRYPSDAVLGQMAKESSPQCLIDTDKPIWGENVVGMALGLFDSVQVCHNHYHREATLQNGRIGWGMADVEGQAENLTEDELFHRTNSVYYRFLNCGFKLAATGGSAMGVMAVPLGYSRTYAKLNGPLTEANYLKAIRAGRTFATSGPMLIMTANGLDSGSEIRYSTGSSMPVSIKAELRSIERIDSLELISNGEVVKSVDLKSNAPSPVLTESLTMEFRPKQSGWIAARAIFKSPDGHLRQAHTSPVYFSVDGKPTASRADAEYMIRWIDRLLEISNKPDRYKSDRERTQTQAVFRKARGIYEGIARRSQTQR